MNATATHDTKRGEDVRARLNVLSEIPAEWKGCLRKWHDINRERKVRIGDREAPGKGHVVAFARELGERRALIVAPRFPSGLVKDGDYPLGEAVWHETRVLPPPGSRLRWRHVLTGQTVQGEEALWLREVFQHFPVALLINEPG